LTNEPLRCFLITHAHLDHVASLVLSAGSFKGCQKRVYGHKGVLDNLETVFSDRIWPALSTWNENDDETYKLLLTP
jgi:cAMP phosphodiesterase